MIEIGNAELAVVAGGDPSPGESDCADAAVLRDVAARVDFDLGRGVFSLSTPSATKAIRDAFASVEGWKSTDAGYKRRVISKTADRMLIECAGEDAPTLLLEFALQPGFIGLRTGLKNTTTALIRIKKFEPLSGGTVFPGGKWSDTRTLTAVNGHTPVAMSNLTVCADGKLAVLALDSQKNETVEWCVNFAAVNPIESAYEKEQRDE